MRLCNHYSLKIEDCYSNKDEYCSLQCVRNNNSLYKVNTHTDIITKANLAWYFSSLERKLVTCF